MQQTEVRAISTNESELISRIASLEKQITAMNDENIKQRRMLEDTLYNLDGDNIPALPQIISAVSDNGAALAQFKVEVSDTYATAEMLSQYESETSTAIAAVKTYADSTFATTEQLSQYQSDANTAIASVKTYADNTFATTQQLSQYQNSTTQSIASVKTYADSTFATTTALAQLRTEASSSISQIQQTVDADSAKISLLVSTDVYGKDSINAASIVAAVNSSGSTVRINADKIVNTGTTVFLTANDVGAGGSTVIDGGRINTQTISSEKLVRASGTSFIDMAANTRVSGTLAVYNPATTALAQIYIENSGVFRIANNGAIYLYPDFNGNTGSDNVYISGSKVITTSNISQYVSSVAAVFG